jgi:O-antigen/teichoic acid export membrane protein
MTVEETADHSALAAALTEPTVAYSALTEATEPMPAELPQLDTRTYGVDVKRIGKASALNLVGAAVSTVAGLALTVVVTRNVSQEVAGLYFALGSVYLIVAAAARLGTETGAVYRVAQQQAQGEQSRLRATVRVAMTPIVVLSALLAVILWFTAGSLVDVLGAQGASGAVGAIRTFAVFLPAAVVGTVALSVGRGLGTTLPYVAMERILRPGLQFVIAVLVIVTTIGNESIGLAVSYVSPYLITLVISVLWSTRLRRRAERRASVKPAATTSDDWAQFWRYTGPRAGTGMLQLALQRLDVILMSALRGPAEAALYTAATRLLVIGQMGGQSLSMAVQHRFSALLSRRNFAEANELYQMTTAWLIVMTWPIYLLWALFAYQVTGIFGRGYSSAGNVGVILALAMLVATGCGMVSMVLEMAGNTGIAFTQTAIALVANIAVDIVLIPKMGPMGAAIGWAVSILLNNLLPLARLNRAYGMFPLGRSAYLAMASALVSFVAIPGTVVLVAGHHLVPDLAGVIVGAGLYAALMWRLRSTLQLSGLVSGLRRRRGAGAKRTPAS